MSFLENLLLLFQNRSENISEFLSGMKYMLSVKDLDLSKESKELIKNTNKQLLNIIFIKLNDIENWNATIIESCLKEIAKKENINLFNVASPVRAAVTGKNHSPSIFKILELLGRENTLKRLKKAF